VRETRDGDGDAEGDVLGAGEPTVGEGLALGLALGEAVPGDRLALGRLVRSGAGVVRCGCGRCGGAVVGGADVAVPVTGESPAPPVPVDAVTGRTST
jgi:hypothetical protein